MSDNALTPSARGSHLRPHVIHAHRAWFVLVLLGGCAGVARPREPYTDATAALRAQSAPRARLQSLRAEARVDQRGAKGRVRGTVLMMVERAGRLRFDAMTQFGPVAILTADRERFAFTDLREHRYLSGATCPRNIARLVGIPMTVEQVTAMLLGGTFVLEHVEAHIAWNEDGFYRVVLRAASGARQELDLEVPDADLQKPPAQQRVVLRRSELFAADGKSQWRASYDDYERVGGKVELPLEVRVEQRSSGTDTLLRFKEITLDPVLPDAAFTQTPRAGLVQEDAACE